MITGIFAFSRLWLVFGLAGALGFFGWPRFMPIALVGLALGGLATAAALEDLGDHSWVDLHYGAAFALFVALHALGLKRRRAKR